MEGKSKWGGLKEHTKINKPLLPLKAVMFLYYGATTTFLPYITLHMIQIGITIEEVAIIYAILPFASCIGPPIAGMIADRIGQYKPVLIATILGTGIFHTLLLTIDASGHDCAPASEPSTSSNFHITCDQSGRTFLQWQSRSSNESCADEIQQLGNVIQVHSDCQHSCGNNYSSSADLCSSNDDCSTLSDDLLTLNFDNMMKKQVKKPDMCSLPISKLSVYNTSDPVRLVCQCQMRCAVSMAYPSYHCPENMTVSKIDSARHQRGFWLYLSCRIMATAFLGTSFTMLDASTICLIKKHKGDLGKQRVCGVIGSAIFALASGALIDWMAEIKGYSYYAITFYCADGLFLFVMIFLSFLDVTAEKSEGNFWRNVLKLIRLIDVDIFMTMMMVLGTCWGFLEAYLFIFLKELKASNYLLGFTVTFGSLVGLPFLYISDLIVTKIGKIGILLAAFFIYCIRFVGYSFITDPWLSLPFEGLEAVTIHLMAVSMSMFCASAAPVGLLATLHGLSGAFHYSIGRGAGSFIGGILIAEYGTRMTFQIFGITVGLCGFVYIALYFLVMRKYDKERLKQAAANRRESINFHSLKKGEGATDEPDPCKKAFLTVPNDEFLARRLSLT